MTPTRFFILLGTLATLLVISGCQESVFTGDSGPNSPFDRYAVLHGRQPRAVERDQFGTEKPPLRQRLRPAD